MTDYDITGAMIVYGGSFVQALARAWRCADAANQAKLKAAFPEYWEQYRGIAQMKSATKEEV